MIDEPSVVIGDSFQEAWVKAAKMLIHRDWETRNLIVQMKNPKAFDGGLHQRFDGFCGQVSILSARDVAYTIFPHDFYEKAQDAEHMFASYNRANGLYDRLQRRYAHRGSWGTYFRRMTHYDGRGEPVNQLRNVINAINSRGNVSKAALTIVIQKPGTETTRPLGGPCLNYLAVHQAPGPKIAAPNSVASGGGIRPYVTLFADACLRRRGEAPCIVRQLGLHLPT